MLLQVIDVLIGLTVVYLIFSSVASTLAEMLEAMVRKRGAILLRGIEEIFKAAVRNADGTVPQQVDALVLAFYQSPQIASLFGGTLTLINAEADDIRKRLKVEGGRLPSYIPAERFAAALHWLQEHAGAVAAQPGTPEHEAAQRAAASFRQIVNATVKLGACLAPHHGQSAADALGCIAAFYQSSTDRLSGWYRRRVQWVLLFIGVSLSLLLNLDTLRIAQVLSQDDKLRSQIVSQSLQDVHDAPLSPLAVQCSEDATLSDCEQRLRESIDKRLSYADALGLPMGWRREPLVTRLREAEWHWRDPHSWVWDLGALIVKLLGCLITALAICQGGPFWFDLLNKLASVRTALRPPPPEKAKEKEGKAATPAAEPLVPPPQ